VEGVAVGAKGLTKSPVARAAAILAFKTCLVAVPKIPVADI